MLSNVLRQGLDSVTHEVYALQVGYWLCLHWGLGPSVAALAVHVMWGQLSSLLVELIAASTGMWAYEPKGWDLSIVQLQNGKHLTVLPQAIWLVASCAFTSITFLMA